MMVFVYTTCPDIESAKKIGSALLKKRLAACCNYWPIQSSYWWQGKIVNESEAVLLVKSTKKQIANAKRYIEKIHPYGAPCIAVLPAKQLNAEYKKWLVRECQ